MVAPVDVAHRRMLLVHAHPDDETITTGATMARYAAEGVGVTLLTCTLGEQGEVLVPDYAGLAADQADQLGGLRIGELSAAMRALGVGDHRFLGGAGRFRDSGMLGTSANRHPRAFWRADTDPQVFAAAVDATVEVIREVRPQVVVTYDDRGDYGHPDHLMAHRVTTAALAAAADPTRGPGEPWSVAKLYWTATPRSVLESDFVAVSGLDGGFVAADPDDLPFGVPDHVVTTTVDAEPFCTAKRAALAAHRTQIIVAGGFFALSNNLGRKIRGVEHYRLVTGGHVAPAHETDLFAGLGI